MTSENNGVGADSLKKSWGEESLCITILTSPRAVPALLLEFAVSAGFSWVLRTGGPPGLTVHCQLVGTRVEIPLLS